jgi:hypothetical protein
MEKIFWNHEWLGIKFESLEVQLYPDKLPTSEFYEKFYAALFSKYDDFDALPLNWRENKTKIAIMLSQQIPTGKRVFSYGCGIGFIEYELFRMRPDIALSVYDFAENSSIWIRKFADHIQFTNQLDKNIIYDVVYLSQVLYALLFEESTELLQNLRNGLSSEGRILLVNTSVISKENENHTKLKIKTKIKALLRQPLRKIYRFFVPIPKIQMWGWKRDVNRYTEIARMAGLKPTKIFSTAHQSIIELQREE